MYAPHQPEPAEHAIRSCLQADEVGRECSLVSADDNANCNTSHHYLVFTLMTS